MTLRSSASGSGGRRAGIVAIAAMSVLLGGLSMSSASAADPAPVGPILDKTTMLQAPVDECFAAIGDNTAPNADGSCPEGYQPKVNGAYVWSGARSGDFAYFGTYANALCTGVGAWDSAPPASLLKDGNVCEFGEGAGAEQYGSRAGDARLSHIYRVNADTGKSEDITPADDPLLKNVTGLRGAAAAKDVVFFSGLKRATATDPTSGVVMLAFEGSTGKFLGSHLNTDLMSARLGAVGPDGNLYLSARQSNATSGVILRWSGDKANPFQFETVGLLSNDAAYITRVGNRLAVSGWTGLDFTKTAAAYGGPAKVWMSPEITSEGLTEADKDSWKPILSWDDYDPDSVLGKSIVWGGITEWRGDLYVGSYNHVALTSTMSLWDAYGKPATEAERLRDVQKSNRAATIFKISQPGTPQQKVTLLYGEKSLPVYDPQSKTWTNRPNKLGQTPKFGLSGFGNPANQYSWTFSVFKDKLYMATFDGSGAIAPSAFSAQRSYGMSDSTRTAMETVVGPSLFKTSGGADVWRMDDPEKPAVPETLTGFGNHAQHGVRVFLPFEDKGFMLAGTAATWNLRAGDTDRGGWSVEKLTPGQTRAPLDTSLSADVLKGAFGVAGQS